MVEKRPDRTALLRCADGGRVKIPVIYDSDNFLVKRTVPASDPRTFLRGEDQVRTIGPLKKGSVLGIYAG